MAFWNLFRTRYRVVRDNYCGYEVQSWRWWFPIWLQCNGLTGDPTNTHYTLESAICFIEAKKCGGEVVHRE